MEFLSHLHSFEIDFEKFDTYLSYLERGGNKLGYFFGTFTGPVRIAMGKVLMIASLILGTGYLLAYAFDPEKKTVHLKEARKWAGYFAHGTLNVIRGIFETFTLSGGILLLAAYDLSAHRFHYFQEEIGPGSFTLNPFRIVT